MFGVGEEIPVLLPGLIPLPQLPELISHEVQLFPRVGRHVQIQSPGLGKFSLVIPPHFLENGGLPVDGLVVGEGQEVALIVEVGHGEGEESGVIRPPGRLCAEIIQGVVHPPHVPLVVEPQPILVGGAGDAREGGGVLGDEHGVGDALLEAGVHVLEKADAGLAHTPVRLPLPVDQIVHGVHAQAVEMVLGQPVEGGGLEKAAHLPPGVHEIAAAPLVAPHILAGIFVEGGAVIIPQGVVVDGEVDGDEVQQHADAVLVAEIHELLELLRGAVAGGGGEETGGLVSPGAVVGILPQGHQLHVVVAVLPQPGNQDRAQLPVGVPVRLPVPLFPPGAEMELVDINRPLGAVPPAAHPFPVPEDVAGGGDDGGGAGPELGGEAVGIAVVQKGAVRPVDAELVAHAGLGLGDDGLPEISVIDALHLQLLPLAEVADDRYFRGFGGEGAECGAGLCRVRSQVFVGLKFLPCIESVKVHEITS